MRKLFFICAVLLPLVLSEEVFNELDRIAAEKTCFGFKIGEKSINKVLDKMV